MGEREDNVGVDIETASVVCVSQSHEVGGHHYHFFNHPGSENAL